MTISISRVHGKNPFNNKAEPNLLHVSGVRISCTTNSEVALVPSHGIWVKGYQFGPTFQCGKAGGVVVALTQDDVEFAMVPANDANVSWYAYKTFVANEMHTPGLMFTVMKITFSVGPNVFTCLSA